jgi:hypothetical protein
MASPGKLRRVALERTDVSEETSASIIRHKNRLTKNSVRRLIVTANVIPSSPILATLMMEAVSSSETSVLTRATRRNIPEDSILRSHPRENLKSYRSMKVPGLPELGLDHFLPSPYQHIIPEPTVPLR